MHQFISKFTLISKKARFTFKQLVKMIIGSGMTSQEKNLVTKMIYNQEVILVQDFTKIRKVKKKVALA